MLLPPGGYWWPKRPFSGQKSICSICPICPKGPIWSIYMPHVGICTVLLESFHRGIWVFPLKTSYAHVFLVALTPFRPSKAAKGVLGPKIYIAQVGKCIILIESFDWGKYVLPLKTVISLGHMSFTPQNLLSTKAAKAIFRPNIYICPICTKSDFVPFYWKHFIRAIGHMSFTLTYMHMKFLLLWLTRFYQRLQRTFSGQKSICPICPK